MKGDRKISTYGGVESPLSPKENDDYDNEEMQVGSKSEETARELKESIDLWDGFNYHGFGGVGSVHTAGQMRIEIEKGSSIGRKRLNNRKNMSLGEAGEIIIENGK